jgi:hypothetical protein
MLHSCGIWRKKFEGTNSWLSVSGLSVYLLIVHGIKLTSEKRRRIKITWFWAKCSNKILNTTVRLWLRTGVHSARCVCKTYGNNLHFYLLRTAFFCVITQGIVIISFRRFWYNLSVQSSSVDNWKRNPAVAIRFSCGNRVGSYINVAPITGITTLLNSYW